MKQVAFELLVCLAAAGAMAMLLVAGTGPRYMDTPTANDVREATERCERLDLRADVRMDYWGDVQVACVP